MGMIMTMDTTNVSQLMSFKQKGGRGGRAGEAGSSSKMAKIRVKLCKGKSVTRIKILQKIVWCPVEVHTCCHGREVAVDLTVAQPEDGKVQEYQASFASSRYLTDEFVIPKHRFGSVFFGIVGWHRVVPEVRGLKPTVCSRWVDRPFALDRQTDDPHGVQKD
jgi:hypothetical protein